MDLILLGMQGSGKGTQSRVLSQRYNLAYFETGGALRKLSKENSPLGQKVKSIIEAGHLVPTEVVMEIVQDFIDHTPHGQHILFDGIPRSIEQQKAFDEIINEKGRKAIAVFIELSEAEALKRLTSRRTCPTCKIVFPADYGKESCEHCGAKLTIRSDDKPEPIKARIEAFKRQTIPVIETYKQRDALVIVNGEQSIEKVSLDLFEKLDRYYSLPS